MGRRGHMLCSVVGVQSVVVGGVYQWFIYFLQAFPFFCFSWCGVVWSRCRAVLVSRVARVAVGPHCTVLYGTVLYNLCETARNLRTCSCRMGTTSLLLSSPFSLCWFLLLRAGRLGEFLRQSPHFSDERKFQILPLHSGVPTAKQRQVFVRPPKGCRKVRRLKRW